MCSPTDPPAMCQLKKGQCFPLSTVFSPKGGPVKAITSCANVTGTVLGPQFYTSIGKTEAHFSIGYSRLLRRNSLKISIFFYNE